MTIIFTDFSYCSGKSSIAFKFWSSKDGMIHEWCNALNSLPQSFTHVYGIVSGNISPDIWEEIQQNLIRGNIRLYPAKDLQHGSEFMNICITHLMDNSKMEVQKEYFKSVCLFSFL
jgi:hypothetical protein